MTSEHEPRSERELGVSGWMIVRKYPSAPSALEVFGNLRDVILEQNIDASVLRFKLDEHLYVTILGETPLKSFEQNTVDALLAEGQESELPDEMVDHLRARRRAFKATGFEYLERRTVPKIDPGNPA